MSKKNKQAALAAKPVGEYRHGRKMAGSRGTPFARLEQEAALVTILVARRSPMTNKVAAGLFWSILACLGVKSAQLKLFAGTAEYHAGLRAHALKIQPMARLSSTRGLRSLRPGWSTRPTWLQARPGLCPAQHLLAALTRPAAIRRCHRRAGGQAAVCVGAVRYARRVVDQLTRRKSGPAIFTT